MNQNTLTEKELTEQATEAGKEYASKYGQIAGGHVTATCVFADGYIAGYSASRPPSIAKPSVNGELLGFLEIEIEKANKNGKDCNLKDGDLNRAQAWYSAAESFSIVKNKITELSNTPRGHESSIINCPSCNTVWDLSRHNSCQCGAALVTKASPAKADQEGPWKYEVHHDLGPEDTDEWVTITDGRVTLRFDQHEDEEGEEKVVALLNQLKAKISFHDNADIADYYKEQLDELRAQQKQEGLRWVKATMFNYKPNSRYYARWGDRDGAIKSTGWFQQSDGTFFWNENGFVPVLKKEHDQLYILDESTTPPVKEAGQPSESEKDFEDLLEAELNKLPYTKHVDDGQYNDGQCAGFELGARWAQSRQQPAPSGFRWVPITQWGKVKRDITKVLVKYDTGEIRRFSEDDQPANLQTHFMDLSDSPAPVQVNLVAFANWIGEQAYYPDQISRNWAWEGCIPGQEITTECLLEKYIQSLQNNKP